MNADPHADIRRSAIAGRWYPGDAPALRDTIRRYLEQTQPDALPGKLLALVVPHAGYRYSGPTAAAAFAQLRGSSFARVILFGPLHRPIFGARAGTFMVSREAAYRTPLGDLPLDRAYIDALSQREKLTAVAGDEEHALEIELPFLQTVLREFSIVPVLFGESVGGGKVAERLSAFASAIAALWDDRTLLVVSTDLTHDNDYREVNRRDRVLVDLLTKMDVSGLYAALSEGRAQACGAGGLVTALMACQRLGARSTTVLAQTTSANVTGDRRPGSYTVGYLAAAICA